MLMNRFFLIFFLSIVPLCFMFGQGIGLSLHNVKGSSDSARVFKADKRAGLVDYGVKSVVKEPLAHSFYPTDYLPFFCKIEYQMGLNKKLPIKFRLGSVPYVDELEGKGVR